MILASIFGLLQRHLVLIGCVLFALWGLGLVLESGWSSGQSTSGSTSLATDSEPVAAAQADAPSAPVLAENSRFRPAAPLSSLNSPSIARTRPEVTLQSARKLFWENQLDDAAAAYRRYTENFPDDPDGFGELGNVLLKMGQVNDAQRYFEQAAKLLEAAGDIDQAYDLRQGAADFKY